MTRERATLAAVLRREVLSLTLMLARLATLAVHGLHLLSARHYEKRVRQARQATVAQRSGARLNEVSLTTQDGRATVTAVVRSPARFTRAEVGAIGERLQHAPDGSAPQLRLRRADFDAEAEGN